MNTSKTNHQESERDITIWAGVFYILATAAPIFTYPFIGFLFSGVARELPSNFLVQIAANEKQIIIDVLIELTYALAVVGIIATLHPILKKYRPVLSLGFFSLRFLEAIGMMIHSLILLCMLTLSQEYAATNIPEASYFLTAGNLLLAAREWIFLIGSGIVWSLSALILNALLYQHQLLPRWISGWGLIGAGLSLAAYSLQFFNIHLPEVVYLPIGVQEMVFAGWLITKGFNAQTQQ